MEVWYDHVHMFSPDPEKAALFYEKMFGAERTWQGEVQGGKRIALKLHGSIIRIAQQTDKTTRSPSTSSSLDHWAVATDDLAGLVAHLKANGAKMRDEIFEMVPGTKIAFVWGPDDVLIELLEKPLP
jgi:lactoylglutathione lyase